LALPVINGQPIIKSFDEIQEWAQIPTSNEDIIYVNKLAYADLYQKKPTYARSNEEWKKIKSDFEELKKSKLKFVDSILCEQFFKMDFESAKLEVKV